MLLARLMLFPRPHSTASEHPFIKEKSHQVEKQQLKPVRGKRKDRNVDILLRGQDLGERGSSSHCLEVLTGQDSRTACAPQSPTQGLGNANCVHVQPHVFCLSPDVWHVHRPLCIQWIHATFLESPAPHEHLPKKSPCGRQASSPYTRQSPED